MCPSPRDPARRAPSVRALLLVLLLLVLSGSPAGSALAQAGAAGDGASTPPAATSSGPVADGKLDRALAARLASAADFDVIRIGVTLDETGLPEHGPERSRQDVMARRRDEIDARRRRATLHLGEPDFRLGRSYENLAGFSARARPAAIRALLQRPEVAHVYVDGEVHATLAQGVPLVGADVAHAAGFTGSGVNVAVLDTGIDTNHPDLADDIVDERCYCDDGGNPSTGCCPSGGETGSGPGSAEDDNGHGTSVAGIVTANGAVTGPGVAPDAGIVAIKVLRANGSGSFTDVAAALDWLLSNHASLGVRVVNLSLSDGGEYANPLASPCSGTNTSNAIRDLSAAGVAVFLASGNDGHDAGISFPACAPDGISVGGVYDANVGSISWCGATCAVTLCTDSPTYGDRFVCHTNSGALLDVLAPDFRTRTSAMGGGVASSFGGTSAASPYAAALAALLFEQQPARSVADVRSLMKSNGPMVTNADNGLAFRRTDVSALFPVCGDGQLDAGEDCDDGNLSGGDCCSAACLFESVGSACDDGSACTAADACDGSGACVAGGPVTCDDGLYCNGPETCDDALGCVAGVPPPLDDLVGCTLDGCDEAFDLVTHVPDDAACDDGDACTAEACDAIVGCTSDPIPGCGVPVPSGRASGPILGLAALGWALLEAGRSRRQRAGSPTRS